MVDREEVRGWLALARDARELAATAEWSDQEEASVEAARALWWAIRCETLRRFSDRRPVDRAAVVA